MERTRLLLVYPVIGCSVTNTHTYSLPLGLGSIATYCKERYGDSLDVKILDGSLITHDEQLKETESFDPHLIGINSTIASQKRAYEIAELAKQNGSLVIFGGVNSTNLWENMLRNRSFIDGVVLFEGEYPMFSILNRLKEQSVWGNDCLEGIPNLAFRGSNSDIHRPSRIHVPHLTDLPDIDYSLFDLDKFFSRTEKKGFGRALTYYGGKGCAKRGGSNLKSFYTEGEYYGLIASMDVCTFCGRNELGARNFEEERELRVIRNLYEQYGVRGFFNVQDTVNLRNSSSIGLENSWFRLFIGTESITPQNIKRLKQRYGLNLILQAGVEAATPQMRRVFGKCGTDADDLISKVELMRDEGIQLHASLILGGRGETLDSMRRTTEVVRKFADYDNVTWVLISPQLILPGSPDYNALLQIPKMYKKYGNRDLIDIREISIDFLSQFAPSLTRDEIIEEIRETFEDIHRRRPDLILDVKGIVSGGESYIKPNNRPYAEM